MRPSILRGVAVRLLTWSELLILLARRTWARWEGARPKACGCAEGMGESLGWKPRTYGPSSVERQGRS